MINNNFTKKLADALARNKGGNSFDRSIMHVEREWYSLVLLAIVLLGTGALWSVYAYKTYSDVSISGEVSTEDLTVYNTELINAALKYTEERREEYEKLRGNLPEISTETREEKEDIVSTATSTSTAELEKDLDEVVIEEDTNAELAI